MELLIFAVPKTNAQSDINIWEHTNRASDRVSLTPYLPAKQTENKHVAVIICPGGSYCWLDDKNESEKVAQWLQKNGITAFILKYKTAGFLNLLKNSILLTESSLFQKVIQDMQKAIVYVRENADEYNINPDNVGVMGFSAGGHLVMTAGIFYQTNSLSKFNIKPTVSLRPKFVASIYPVVTFTDKRYVHHRSLIGLFGNDKNKKMLDSLSLEKQIHAGVPPVFLMNCRDDRTVKYQNSELLDSALTLHKVPHKYIQYNKGGHGFGANEEKASKESKAWKNEFLDWLNTLFN